MPGDLSGSHWTRAVLINAAPEQIWPWLVQFGQGRGGWYSYDWLENLLGFNIHTADRILPEYQNPQIGTPICMSGSICPSAVHVIEPNQWFGWQAADETGKPVWTFVFGLFPEGANRTRLVVRESFDPAFMPPAAVVALEIPDAVMELKMLQTLKARAEGRPTSGIVTVAEITFWLAALVASLLAGWQVLNRPEWRRPMVVFAAGLVVLLLSTFLFLPLWLRSVMVKALFAGLFWKKNESRIAQFLRSSTMKKVTSYLTLFIFIALACASCVSVTVEPPTLQPTNTVLPATAIPSPTLEPATPTPEVFIALTRAVPGEFQPTDAPLTPTDITQPPAGAGTTVTYNPLTVIIPQSLAGGTSGRDFPRVEGEDAAMWQKTPGHLQVSLADYYILQGKTHQPAIYVYPATDYAFLVPAAFESIHRLNNYLYAPNNIPALDQLPGVPFFNTQILFAAHIQPVSFQNGSGIRYISEYAQYPASANNTDQFYNFIGISSDGAYYIVAIFPLTSPVLAETSDAGAALPTGGIPYPDMADPTANMNAYYIAITDLLNAQPTNGFTPHLGELDQLIQSMRIEP
jgi:hypothetical protein